MPYGKSTGKPAGVMGPKKKIQKEKPSAKVNMPAYPGKGTGKKVKVSSMGSKDPIGPQTKRQAKKADRNLITPLSAAGMQTAKEKLKSNRKKAAAGIGGLLGGVATGIYSMVQDKKRFARYTAEERAKGKTQIAHPGYSTLKKMYKGDKKTTKK
jgi:hypothetical protein